MKIALIGSAPSSVALAPYESPEWTIWACSPGARPWVRKCDVWFELHRWEPGQPWFQDIYVNWLKEFNGPVYMTEEVKDVPGCTPLPIDSLVNKYGPYFFTSTIAWMFALAIEQKPETIGMWGIDMAANEEYGYQRAGLQYFAMIAKALGIEVGVPPESEVLRPPPLYGVCEQQHHFIKLLQRQRELTDRRNSVQNEMNMKSKEVDFLNGALDDINWTMNSWVGNMDTMGREYVEPPLVPALVDIQHPIMEFIPTSPGNIDEGSDLE